MDTVKGKIRKVIWHGVGKGSRSGVKFLIAELADGRVIKGEMNDPRYNETYRFVGNLRFDKYNGDHVFFFEHHEELVEQNESGVAQYLARKVDGLGKKKAAALVECFGIDLLRTLQARPELAAQCKAINEKDVESITKWFNENRRVDPAAVAKLLDMFSGHRFPKKLAEQLALDFGSDAPQTIREQPYMLLSYPRMGWATVDPFALAQGYDPAGVDRHRMAIVEAFEQHGSNEGHTYAARPEIDSLAFGLLGTRPSPEAWAVAVEKGDIVSHELDDAIEDDDALEGFIEVRRKIHAALMDPTSKFSLPKLARAERYIARKLADLMAAGRPLPFEPSTTGLNPDQQAAILLFHDNPVSMLLGAPGTGKSYTIARFIHSCVEAGYRNIRFVAPTGKAAKRGDELISQACGGSASIPCTTVHRALAPQPSDAPLGVPAEAAKIGRGREAYSFGKNEGDPLDVDLLIVDETSMMDVKLLQSLLAAIKNGSRLIFVGDINQLPSVGPGSVLRDLKESGSIPFVELSRIVRSDGGGRVVRACHALKDGRVPEPGHEINLPTENWVHLERSSSAEIGDTIVALYESIRNNGNYDPYWDVQVISPQIRTDGIGCNTLNERLSALLNPRHEGFGQESPGFTPDFRVGDKVVRTRNGVVDLLSPFRHDIDERVDWRWDGKEWSISEVDIVNGDMGTVTAIEIGSKQSFVVVQFRNPDRLCRLPYNEPYISPAFAMTVHKSQGSGFPVVITPVSLVFQWNPRTNTGLNSLENFYTDISRTETILFTVGDFSAIETIVRRRTINFRRTLLVGHLKKAFSIAGNC